MIRTVILVQSPLPANERHKKIMPLGLAYLASYLRREEPDLTIRIVDAQAGDMSTGEVVEEVLGHARPGDVVGLGYWTCQAPNAYEISDGLLRAGRDLTIVHGGIHCTIFSEEALSHADYCVLHEGELTFADLVRALQRGLDIRNVEGIAYRDGAEVRRTAPRQFIEDLDLLPFPAWDLLDMEKYDSPLHVVGGNRLPVVGSRGCPYGCTYCGSPFMWKRSIRWRSPENVFAEMKASIEKLHLDQFHFWDDNLMLNREYVEKLCRLIVGEELSIKWTGLTRASHVAKNADLLGLMKKAGCIGLEVGIESANPETFQAINKEEKLKIIEEVGRLHKSNGMSPLFTFMAFNPGETISGYYEQARFIDGLISDLPWYDYFHMFPFPLYVGQFCTPHPGTKLHEDAREAGEVLADSWDDYYHHQINFVPRSLLQDVPVKNARELGGLHYELCNFVIQVAFWSDFNVSKSLDSKRKTLARYRGFLTLFWRYCNGRNTMEGICARAASRAGLDRREAIRFGALTSLVLGQLGVIKSAVYDGTRERKVVSVVSLDGIPRMLEPYPAPARSRLAAFLKGALSPPGRLLR